MSGSAIAGASGTGAGGGAGAGGSGEGLDSSWSGAQKGQWAGTAFDGAVNPDDDDARWGPSFVSNEDATRALFEDNVSVAVVRALRACQAQHLEEPANH